MRSNFFLLFHSTEPLELTFTPGLIQVQFVPEGNVWGGSTQGLMVEDTSFTYTQCGNTVLLSQYQFLTMPADWPGVKPFINPTYPMCQGMINAMNEWLPQDDELPDEIFTGVYTQFGGCGWSCATMASETTLLGGAVAIQLD